MKRKLLLVIITLIVSSFVLVPTLIYAGGGAKKLQAELDECKGNVQELQAENEKLKQEKSNLESEVSSLKVEKSQLESQIESLKQEIAAKEQEIEALRAEAPEPSIIAKTVEEKIQEKEAEIVQLKQREQELQKNVQEVTYELESTKRKLTRTEQQLSFTSERLKKAEQKLKEAEDKIAELENKTAMLEEEKETLTKTINTIKAEKQEIEEALMAYEEIERRSQELMDIALEKIKEILSEEIAAGKVKLYKSTYGIILDITGEYMFDTGKVNINPGGKLILAKIAKLLNDLEGYMIGVIGNADNKPIVTPSLKKRFPTNWELSAFRGAVVVRYLIEKGNISPTRVIAMGFGEYHPVDDNSTPEGRGNNRRVDLVLIPIDVIASVVVGAEVR